jgi:DNA-binding MarR family transcriptional regulator
VKTKDIYLQPGFLIRRAHQMATAVFMEENKVLGLTPVQFGALVAIREVPGTDATRVSDVIFFDRATIGNVLERLEKRGLLVRKPDAEDKRTKRLFLTPKGQAIIKKIDATASRIAQRILAPLPLREHSRFLQMLAKLTEFEGRNSVLIEPNQIGMSQTFGKSVGRGGTKI